MAAIRRGTLLWAGARALGGKRHCPADDAEHAGEDRRRPPQDGGACAAGGQGGRPAKRAQACELLAAAMKQYAADRFNRSAKSLTAVDCYELIAVERRCRAAYRDLIERCEAATYSGTQVNETVDMKNAIELMRTIERAYDESGGLLAMIAAVLCVGPARHRCPGRRPSLSS